MFSKHLIAYTFLFLFSFTCISQNQCNIDLCHLHLDPTIRDISIPYTGNNLANDREADILVEFIDEPGYPYPEAAKGAFLYAVEILAENIESNIPIKVQTRFTQINVFALAVTSINPLFHNFNSTDEFYLSDTYYGSALAEKLANEELNLNNEDVEIQIDIAHTTINDNIFYYGIDADPPEDQADFVTVILHELIHGLNFVGAGVFAVNSSEGGYYGHLGSAALTARFLDNSNGVKLTDFPIETNSTEFSDFVTSDDIFWFSSSASNDAKIYAPTNWAHGSSLSHLDLIYDDTPNALMTPGISLQEAIHDPGPITWNILSDIGWEPSIPVGIEDDLSIHNFDMECFTNLECPYSYFEDLLSPPDQELNIGDLVQYAWWFVDEEPYNGSPAISWKFEVLHNEGKYLLSECLNGNSCNQEGASQVWEFTVPDLPLGYHWSRNLKNQVKARLTVSGVDSQGYYYEEKLGIVLNYIPDIPEIEFLQTNVSSCESVTLSFFGSGADYYLIELHLAPWPSTLWLDIWVPEDQYTYTLNNLNPLVEYSFRVTGFNDEGQSMISNTITRPSCGITKPPNQFLISPNPSNGIFNVSSLGTETIQNIEIFNQNNPNIASQILGGAFVDEINVNISNSLSGIYEIVIFTNNGLIECQQYLKL